MFFWQSVIVLIIFSTVCCWAWPPGESESKICFQFTDSNAIDPKCSLFCQSKNKLGGTCKKRRCVCYDKESNENSNEDQDDNKQKRIAKLY